MSFSISSVGDFWQPRIPLFQESPLLVKIVRSQGQLSARKMPIEPLLGNTTQLYIVANRECRLVLKKSNYPAVNLIRGFVVNVFSSP
jgi:hypothetical protein